MKRSNRLVIAAGFAMGLVSIALLPAAACDDWPHWRGSDRNGHVKEPSRFADGKWEMEEIWTAQVGLGSSSPVVIDDLVYTLGWEADEEHVVCRRTDNGEVKWKRSYASPRYGRDSVGDKQLYIGSLATPSFDAASGFLYTLGIDGDLACWDTRDEGKSVWSFNLHDRFEIVQRPDVAKNSRRNTQRDYGYSTSPLIHQDWLIVEVGSTTGNLVAFNKTDGSTLWSSENRDEAGHTGGPVPIAIDGEPGVVTLTLRNLVVTSLNPETAGRTIGELEWTTDYGNNVATPTVQGQAILVSSAYNQYAMARVDATLSGLDVKWRIENPSGVCSPVVHDGRVYWAWHGMHAVDFETGAEQWKAGKVGDPGSCLVTSDEKMIVYYNRGALMLYDLANLNDGAPQLLAEKGSAFRKDVWPHVTLSNGKLLLRDRDGNMKCLQLR